jgi:arginase family enzyme
MESKESVMSRFDPNGPGIPGNLFGLPFSSEHCELIIVPAPWEVTVSYHGGTVNGPQVIRDASSQVDLYIKDMPDAWKLGVTMMAVPAGIKEQGEHLRKLTFYDEDLKGAMVEGKSLDSLCSEIIKSLPTNVYISLDIDANVGARMLYQLCHWAAVSQGKLNAVRAG